MVSNPYVVAETATEDEAGVIAALKEAREALRRNAGWERFVAHLAPDQTKLLTPAGLAELSALGIHVASTAKAAP